MCGIWGFLKNNINKETLINNEILLEKFNNVGGRGPEDHKYNFLNNNMILGFHRLKINDSNELANQPFTTQILNKEYHLICNGEIYNFIHLKNDYSLIPKSNSDCEVILHLFLLFGADLNAMKKTVNLLKGVFAGGIFEVDKNTDEIKMYLFRDRIGVRPMFYGRTQATDFGFSSEIKGLSPFFEHIKVFQPGTIMYLENKEGLIRDFSIHEYYFYNYNINKDQQLDVIKSNIKEKFTESVRKRMMSDRPLCCLLSGGLDSSLVASVLSKISTNKIHTFCIGMKGGTDFKYAQQVADYIGSIHKEVYFTPEDGCNAIKDVIWATETFDITTIRASVGQYLISKWLKENTEFKVVYIGDGSDELTGGYKYFCKAPDADSLDQECRKLIKEIHLYDALRADRAVSIHGLETRVPFLDSDFVDYYLEIDPEFRMAKDGIEKYLLRSSFDDGETLPDNVLWREKEAFSDGVSSLKKTWFQIIQEWIDTFVTDEEYEQNKDKYKVNPPNSKESYYYRKTFDELFGDQYNNVIPHFWLPKWVGNVSEPSARVLDVYKSNKSEKIITND